MKFLDINGLDKEHLPYSSLPLNIFKRKKLGRAVGALAGAALCSLSSLAYSLGLGEIQSTSFIGQPLSANIELVSLDGDIDLDRLIVRQVTEEEAKELGVELIGVNSRFELKIDSSQDVPFISVESKEAIKEPYLNLLVELRWPNGVLFREYPVLLDPPPKAPVITAKKTTPPKQRVQARPAPRTETRPSTAISPKPVAGAREVQAEALLTSEGKYQVKSGDTLSKIAERWREGTDRGIYDTMEWLYENNLHAFTNQNIDLLRAGAVLQMPDLSAYSVDNEIPSESEKSKAVLVKEPSEGAVKPATAEKLDQQVRDSVTHIDLGEAQSERGLLTVGTVSQDDSTRELIDMLVRENESLRARMEKIENSEYLETLKQLIILQRQQISDLRTRVGVSDVDNNQEIDALLTRIGMEEDSEPRQEIEAVLNNEELTVDNQAENAKVELASENAVAKKDKDESLAPVKVDPILSAPVMASRTEKGWLIWVVIGGAATILTAFAGLFIYYRKITSPTKPFAVEEEVEEDDLFGPLDEEDLTVKSSSIVTSSESDGDVEIEYTGEDPSEYKPKHEAESWMGDSAEVSDKDLVDMDLAMKEVQEAFDDLLLDEDVLDELEKETALEAITQELPEAKIDEPRRTDDEVRLSIAEKMAQYNPEEYRKEIENLGLLELDELSEFDDQQDDIETAIYRAMMFCEFKKFEKAKELVLLQQQESDDPRLADALEQVAEMEALAKEASKQQAG